MLTDDAKQVLSILAGQSPGYEAHPDATCFAAAGISTPDVESALDELCTNELAGRVVWEADLPLAADAEEGAQPETREWLGGWIATPAGVELSTTYQVIPAPPPPPPPPKPPTVTAEKAVESAVASALAVIAVTTPHATDGEKAAIAEQVRAAATAAILGT